ncbi:MAG: hypothetical protein IPK32_14505 [Verrucomicrobiaceae bacterium]|nr:hypothetical protein [Verrucomicrobiaceae bacterium]
MHHALLLITAALSSCVMPPPIYTNQPYLPPSPQEQAIARANINAVEDESYAFRQRERMGQAAAIEKATRNNPRSISNTSNSVWISR